MTSCCCRFIQRREVMKRLIQRYLLTFEKSKHQSHDPPELAAERLDDSSQLRDLITQLQGVLRKAEDSSHPLDLSPKQTQVKCSIQVFI